MTVWFETGALGVSCAAACAAVMIGIPSADANALDRLDHFAESDFNRFERNFELDGKHCEVGLPKWRECFSASPMEAQIVKGEALPSHWPIHMASVETRISISPKSENYLTARYGQTLVLVDRDTRRVIDMMDLTPETRS